MHNRLTLRADRGPIGIGLVGIGGWGMANAVHLMKSRRFSIAGVHDLRHDLARAFACRYGVSCYENMDDMLSDSSIRAVCITVPNPLHPEFVRSAANASKHVFIEKPLASHPDECRRLGEYCRQKKVVLQVGHQMRREPFCREIDRLLKTKELGDPLFVQAVSTLDRRLRDDWRRDARCCLGGSMEQLGVHLIDVLIYLFGSPVKTGNWSRDAAGGSVPSDWAWVSMQFPGNVCASVSTSFSSPQHMRLEIFCERGRIGTDGQTLSIVHDDGRLKKQRPSGLPGSISQFIEFADCIETGQNTQTGATAAAVVMEVVHPIVHSRGM